MVHFGLTMEFAEVSVCQFVPPVNFSAVKIKIIHEEISKLLSKVVIENNTRKPNDYVSKSFTRTKQDVSYTMILKLKTFNEFWKFRH